MYIRKGHHIYPVLYSRQKDAGRHGEWLGDILYVQQKNKPSKY